MGIDQLKEEKGADKDVQRRCVSQPGPIASNC